MIWYLSKNKWTLYTTPGLRNKISFRWGNGIER